MSLRQLFLILMARWRSAFLVFAVVIGAALAVSFLLSKSYTATTSLVVDVKTPDPLVGAMMPSQYLPGYMATQVDIINSRSVAEKVVRLLRMDQSAEQQSLWREVSEGKGDFIVWKANQLKTRLEVNPSRESNVISISFSGPDPELVTNIANAFADAYIDTSLELKVEPARKYAQWFLERMEELRENLERAQRKLSSYQQEHGIVVNDERLDIEVAHLSGLHSQLAEVQGKRADISSRQSQASSSAESLPEVIESPLIRNLQEAVARQEANLVQLESRFGRNHPQYLDERAQLETLKQQIALETQRIVRSINTAARVNEKRVAEILAEIDAKKDQILRLRAQRDQIQVLQRDVGSAQHAYDLVAQRLTQVSLESETQQTNIAVLNKAAVPLSPSSPKILVNLLVAVGIGIVLGIGVALILELIDQRVRSTDDLERFSGVPVLGVIPRDDRKSRRMRARAEAQLAIG